MTIFCNNCGKQVEDNSKFCPHCGSSVNPATQVEDAHSEQIPNYQGQMPKNYLVEAILVTILCCLPFGIVAIVYASKVEGAYVNNNYDYSIYCQKKARFWTRLGFFIGLGVILLYFLFVLIVGAASVAAFS